jgi:hypothetical protein
MSKITKIIVLISCVAFLGFGIMGCGQDEPAQRTGQPAEEEKTNDRLDEGTDTTFEQEPVESDRFGDQPGEGEGTGDTYPDTQEPGYQEGQGGQGQTFDDRPGERRNETPVTPGQNR